MIVIQKLGLAARRALFSPSDAGRGAAPEKGAFCTFTFVYLLI